MTIEFLQKRYNCHIKYGTEMVGHINPYNNRVNQQREALD
jgi:hypothetical protein